MSAASALSCYCNNHIPCLLCDNVAFNLLSKYFFRIIILKKNRNVYAKIYYKLPSQILIFWYLWQIGLTNICLIETLDKYFILRYDENCGSCFAAEYLKQLRSIMLLQKYSDHFCLEEDGADMPAGQPWCWNFYHIKSLRLQEKR